ncbi:hypothetical protein MXB_3351, partial [Myxobolus squamalis]
VFFLGEAIWLAVAVISKLVFLLSLLRKDGFLKGLGAPRGAFLANGVDVNFAILAEAVETLDVLWILDVCDFNILEEDFSRF